MRAVGCVGLAFLASRVAQYKHTKPRLGSCIGDTPTLWQVIIRRLRLCAWPWAYQRTVKEGRNAGQDWEICSHVLIPLMS